MEILLRQMQMMGMLHWHYQHHHYHNHHPHHRHLLRPAMSMKTTILVTLKVKLLAVKADHIVYLIHVGRCFTLKVSGIMMRGMAMETTTRDATTTRDVTTTSIDKATRQEEKKISRHCLLWY